MNKIKKKKIINFTSNNWVVRLGNWVAVTTLSEQIMLDQYIPIKQNLLYIAQNARKTMNMH